MTDLDPTTVTLETWLSIRGQRSGTATYNGVTYSDLSEVEWRQANNGWLKPQDTPHI